MARYTKADCLAALRRAQEISGSSPTKREYRDLDILPSESTITSHCGSWNEAKREAGLKLRTDGREAKSVRSDYFETIDTTTTAYWLGMLFGDGSLMKRRYSYRVQLTLKKDDETHLRRYKRAIAAESGLIEDGGVYHLRVGNKQFAENLKEKGFTETKGVDGALPDLKRTELRRSFVRGLADADGYYGTNKFTITDNTAKRLQKLQSWLPVKSEIVHENVEDRSWAYLKVSIKRELIVLYLWLFPRGNKTEPAMARKREPAIITIRERVDGERFK